jgi:hypothetical protein
MKNELTLFQIAQEYRAIADVLMDSGCDEQTLQDTLEAEGWDLECKAQNYGFVIRNLEAGAAAIKQAEEQMASRRKAMENRVKMLQQRLKDGMEMAGVSKLECPYFAISIAKNPAAVEILDERQIPIEFMKIPEPPPATPDKTAIKEALKAGQDVPGAKLTQGTRLSIK